MKSEKPTVIISNRKAEFEYFLTDRFEAGIVLTGTEIKSIRLHHCGLNEAYCVLINGELYVKQMHIAHYTEGTYNNHEEKRDRKLLLNKNELKKIINKVKDKGVTIIPTQLYLNEKQIAKLEIAIARGKKKYDKRNSLKEKEQKREVSRNLKGN
ncbi:MAG: SsrA-binding protein SmpB [Bacteroidetes bacterium]|nr:SsrA-binding protein SmpB [Bacteroidota bacterium]